MTKALLIYNSRLLDENMDTPGAVLSVDGKIRAVFQGYFTNANTVSTLAKSVLTEDGYGDDCVLELFDAAGLTLTPAFIDMHVHFRYPGQTQKEDLTTGMQAAAAGGFGTVVAMPNTTPVVSSLETSLQIQKEACEVKLGNMFQTVSITENFDGKTTSHLDFLDSKHVPVISEDGRDVESTSVMLEGMQKAAEKGIVVSCHCEDTALALKAREYRKIAFDLMKQYEIPTWSQDEKNLENVPENVIETIDRNLSQADEILRLAEHVATERTIELATEAGCRIHLAHVSTAECLSYIENAKEMYGENVTCEITPHHLSLSGNHAPNNFAVVNPPLRNDEDRLCIIDAIKRGVVDCISTDHAPHTLEDKANGSPGFTGLETAFGVCYSVLHGEIPDTKLSQLMSANPARILGLNKGVFKPEYDADFTIFDPDSKWTVDSSIFYSKGKATPFEGKELTGKIRALFIGGRLVLEM